MRTLLMSAMLLFSFVAKTQPWQWLNPTPNGYPDLKMTYTDTRNGFIVNTNGDLLVTHDQGSKWEIKQSFGSGRTAAMAIKDSLGVIAGNNALFISRNNGSTWQSIATPAVQDFAFVNVVNRDTFFIAAKNGNLYRTDNAGLNWKTLSIKSPLTALEFVNSKVGYAGSNESSLIKRTLDGGTTWDTLRKVNGITSVSVKAIHFANINIGYVLKEGDSVLITRNGGITWQASHVQYGSGYNDIFFVDTITGYSTGDDGALMKTIDGGKTWVWAGFNSNGNLISDNDLFSINFISSDTGFVVGARGRIMKTTNGGVNWMPYSPTYGDIYDIEFPTPSIGYTTAGGPIYKTTDKGNTWQQLNIAGATGGFRYCHFFNQDTGFALQESPLRISKTKNGGLTWSTSNISPATYPNDYAGCLHFYDANSAYAVFGTSSGSSLYRTTDRGETWDLVNTYSDVYKFFFINGKTGIGTRLSALKRTTDSGKTWATVYDDGYTKLNNVWFINPAKGFAVGGQALLLQTLDSGKTWTKVTMPRSFFSDLNDIKFFDSKVGYILSEYGWVLRTQDGGATWTKDTILPVNMNAIEFTSDSSVYIGGGFGAILKTSVGRYGVDSLRATQNVYCKAQLSAYVNAIYTPIDSVFFEYGPPNTSLTVKATPFNVKDTIVQVTATINNLSVDSIYTARVKLYVGGQVTYPSTPIQFTPTMPFKPVITVRGDTLISSDTTGNQWYLNGTALPGATDRRLVARASGLYTVRSSPQGCLGPMSNGLNFVYTSTIDLSAWNGTVLIYPNPAEGELFITNSQSKHLLLKITDINGRTILQTAVKKQLNSLHLGNITQGVYIVQLTDTRKNETICRMIIRK